MSFSIPPSNDVASRRFQIAAIAIAVIATLLLVVQTDASFADFWSIARGYGSAMTAVVLIWIVGRFIVAMVLRMVRQNAGQSGSDEPVYRALFANLRLGDVVVALLTLTITTSCFTVYKALHVGRSGYGFDAMFIAWDRAIFMGRDGWAVTHSLVPSAQATAFIDFLYHPAFLPMVIGYLACVALQAKPALRYTYMLSYLACFVIVGMVMASLLHSAGPIYDGVLFGDGQTFAPMIDRLATQNVTHGPLVSTRAQGYLIELYGQDSVGLGGGISAMPSMHLVFAGLWMFAAWHLGRIVGVVLTIYTGVIWFGSVHLGWHYFVDGLVSLIVLAAVWYAAGRLSGLFAK